MLLGRKRLLVLGGCALFFVGGSLLIFVAGLLWLFFGSPSPSQALKSVLLKANSGDYSVANKELSSEAKNALGSGVVSQAIWDDITKKGSITKVEILKEEIRGEGATVRFKLLYKDGSVFEGEEKLLKEDGKWKLSLVQILQGRLFDQRVDKPTEPEKDRAWNPDRVGDKPKDPGQNRASNPEPKPPAQKPSDVVHIDSFLGISFDFKAYAMSDANRVKVIDLETGKELASPKWDRDWGLPRSATFGNGVIAVVTGRDVSGESVKVFSRKTGELEQNVRGQVDGAAFTADGRFLAITEFRPGNGYHLVLRDVQGKKTVAEFDLGSNGYCSLAAAGKHVAACESRDAQITVVEAETGKAVMKLKSEGFRKRKEFGGGRMPLAVSQAGNLIACEAEDTVVLYDIDGGKVVHKLEGHLDVVRAVAFSPNGEIVATAAKDKTIRFWNVTEGKEVHAIKNLPSSGSELVFCTDGKRIAIVYREDEFRGARKAEIRSVEPK